jgi:hypothetical protein
LGDHAETPIEREIRLARSAGIPITPSELKAGPVPDGSDAFSLYTDLGKLLDNRADDEDDSVVDQAATGGRLTAEVAERLRLRLTSRGDIVSLVHAIVARSHCVVPKYRGQDPQIIHLGHMRSAARWLAAESALQLYDRAPADAVHTETLVFQVARHAVEDPSLTSYLAAVAIDAIAELGLSHILSAAGSDSGTAGAVRTAVEAWPGPPSLRNALRGEVVQNAIHLADLKTEGPAALIELFPEYKRMAAADRALPALSDKPGYAAFIDTNAVTYLANVRAVWKVADGPYTAKRAIRVAARPADRLVADLLLPEFGAVRLLRARDAARAAVLRAAAAVLISHARYGVFPSTLGAAITPVPKDPIDGKPMRYRFDHAGFTVYSRGVGRRYAGAAASGHGDSGRAVFQYPGVK